MPETSSSSKPVPAVPGTPKSGLSSQHRLLYRGALSLPDSYMLLDGLSFVAEARGNYQSSPAVNLLSNPLALALESMRGRPNLHLLGTERLEDVWIDTKSTISVYIHPYSILSQLYFRNILCLDAIPSQEKRTIVGVRVSLTEESDPDMSEFLIYGQLVSAIDSGNEPIPSSSETEPTIMQMYAARIIPGPPPPVARVPRPDDPTPRKPPAHLLNAGAKRKREASAASLAFGEGVKRTKSGYLGVVTDEDDTIRLAREVMLRGPQGVNRSRGKSELDMFKVPSLPARSGSLSTLDSASPASDVFGSVTTLSSKAKTKQVSEEGGSSELEKANKMVIKQATVSCLAKHGINRRHEDHHDLYQTMYRGVNFALRAVMGTQAVSIRVVDRLLEAHARMYVNGTGENHMSNSSNQQR